MSAVFLVTSGDYSDYKILSVWSTKELAERAVAYYNESGQSGYGEAGIEEWPIDLPGQIEVINSNSYWFDAWAEYKSSYVSVSPLDRGEPEIKEVCEIISYSPVPYLVAPTLHMIIRVPIHIKDWYKAEKCATKIISDMRSQLIALDRWHIGTVQLKASPIEDTIKEVSEEERAEDRQWRSDLIAHPINPIDIMFVEDPLLHMLKGGNK